MPWFFFAPAFVSGLKELLHYPLIRFAICWFLFPLLFFSFSSGKIPTYILPCFPPLDILIVSGLVHYLQKGRTRSFNIGAMIYTALMVLAVLAVVINHFTGFPGKTVYGTSETWTVSLVALSLSIVALSTSLAIRVDNIRRKITLCCVAPLAFFFFSHFATPEQIKVRKCPGELLIRNSQRVKSDTILVSHKSLAASACWFYRRDDVYLFESGGELTYGLSYGGSAHRILDAARFKELVERNFPGKVLLIMKSDIYADYRHLWPKPMYVDDNGWCLLAQF